MASPSLAPLLPLLPGALRAPERLRSPVASLVEPHPPPRLHGGRLHCRVGHLQPVPEGVVGGIGEVGVGLALEGGDLGRDISQVSGHVLNGVGVVPGSGDRVLAHPLRIREGRRIP